MKFFVLTIISGLILMSCSQIQKTADSILKPSAREIYVRELKDNPNLKKWETVFELAKTDSLLIPVPYVEQGRFNPDQFFAYSYDVLLDKGEILNVVVESPDDSIEIFIDVFEKTAENLKSMKSSESGSSLLNFPIKESLYYKVIIQPEISSEIPFTIKIYTQPSYLFPVAGAGNQNIQSFWGADRDAGSRSHEGVDIFAKRGTPVVAGSSGRTGFTGERGLGGKQVWLRDKIYGNSLYYAHLDSISVNSGQKVEKGDTLGFVGNTGNAVYSPPHLHFGVYEGIGGATNPLSFIKIKEIPKAGSGFEKISAKVLKNESELRAGPSSKNLQLSSLMKNDSVFVLGKSDNWYHVLTLDSLKGFMHGSLLRF